MGMEGSLARIPRSMGLPGIGKEEVGKPTLGNWMPRLGCQFGLVAIAGPILVDEGPARTVWWDTCGRGDDRVEDSRASPKSTGGIT